MNERPEIINVIQDAAYEVHMHLKQGYLEAVYKAALKFELTQRGLKVEEEVPLAVRYKGHLVGEYRADLLVNDSIIIELKACSELLPIHETQIINYLTTTGLDYGILINYGSTRFAFRVKTRIYTKTT